MRPQKPLVWVFREKRRSQIGLCDGARRATADQIRAFAAKNQFWWELSGSGGGGGDHDEAPATGGRGHSPVSQVPRGRAAVSGSVRPQLSPLLRRREVPEAEHRDEPDDYRPAHQAGEERGASAQAVAALATGLSARHRARVRTQGPVQAPAEGGRDRGEPATQAREAAEVHAGAAARRVGGDVHAGVPREVPRSKHEGSDGCGGGGEGGDRGVRQVATRGAQGAGADAMGETRKVCRPAGGGRVGGGRVASDEIAKRRSGTRSTSVEAGLAPGTVGRRQVAASRGARDVAGHRRGGPTAVEALVGRVDGGVDGEPPRADQDHVRTGGGGDERGRGGGCTRRPWASRGSATR